MSTGAKDLSILIPARNEMFLRETVADIQKNIRADTEIIVCLDGCQDDPPIENHDRVVIIRVPKAIGQRAGQNLCARLSTARFVMKVDAHCAFDEGFDKKMIDLYDEIGEDNLTLVPVMKNLHVFDWKCTKCGCRIYQDKPPVCPDCGSTKMMRKMLWRAKRSPNSTAYRFNRQLEFKYFPEWKEKTKHDPYNETMSLQGSCFMATRENYWKYELCDESWGSWGGQGAEVAIKTWLSGGRVICNRNTWYAHLFRTKPGFSHPYPNPGKEQQRAKDTLRAIFLTNSWSKATRELQWLVDRFKPVPDWHN